MEGTDCYEVGRGVYYLFYSANHFMNIDYSVGYATASSPFRSVEKASEQSIIHLCQS